MCDRVEVWVIVCVNRRTKRQGDMGERDGNADADALRTSE